MADLKISRPLRLGMVGGGLKSGIGRAHRYAASLDGNYQLVAGIFSRDIGVSKETGKALNIGSDRIYPDFEKMAGIESLRLDGIEVASIVTPNDSHVPAALAFVEQGIDVICDKPLAIDVDSARRLRDRAREKGVVVALTHNYSAYAMVREARERVADGEIGDIRVVQVEHAAAYGVEANEKKGDERLAWRTDPKVAGPSAVLADLGVHAHHLARFITGQELSEVSADLATNVADRKSDDNAHVMMRFASGARGLLWASMVAAGHKQGLRIRVYGDRGSLEWAQESPEELHLRPQHAPHRILRRGEPWLGENATERSRLKAGHPEGFLEGFANLYNDAAELIRARRESRKPHPGALLCPTADDGVRGVEFVTSCVASSNQNGAWVTLP